MSCRDYAEAFIDQSVHLEPGKPAARMRKLSLPRYLGARPGSQKNHRVRLKKKKSRAGRKSWKLKKKRRCEKAGIRFESPRFTTAAVQRKSSGEVDLLWYHGAKWWACDEVTPVHSMPPQANIPPPDRPKPSRRTTQGPVHPCPQPAAEARSTRDERRATRGSESGKEKGKGECA